MPIKRQFGSWSSPITPSVVQNNSIKYTYICQDQCDAVESMTVYWIELRPSENGRNVVMSRNIEDVQAQNTLWTTESFSARTRVHEYGGADIFVHSGSVYFSNDSDQHLYVQKCPQAPPKRISMRENCRYSNGFFCTNLETIYIVREDHNGNKVVLNTIVAIKDDREIIVVEGADFYGSPRVSSSGYQLCWVEWKFPNMPWDNTRVCTARLDQNTLQIVPNSLVVIAEHPDSDPLSCSLPMWTTNNDLLYIKDETGYWNVWVSRDDAVQENLTPVDEDIGDPMWQFDFRKYNYSRIRNQIVVARKGGKLEFKNTAGCNLKLVDLSSKLSYISYPEIMPNGTVVFLGYSSNSRKTIYCLFDDEKLEVIGQSRSLEGIDPKYFSTPQHVKYPVIDSFSHGYLYPPHNPDYCGLDETLPPLLVLAHGGPTAAASTDLNLSIQYWTSRGFSVLDVDYRGSTGYGKEYRHALRGNWGIYDMQDCCEGASYLTRQNLVDGNMLAISGGSAGGYTTLCCLTFSSTFKCGCSRYGIGDLKTLTEDTHKFESRYLDLLIGKYDESIELYRNLSPINFPEKIKCPMIFFQGDEDKIVPRNQSEQMFEAVKSAGIPCSLVIYQGEQHGFRKLENIVHQMESEYYFYGQIFGFGTPDVKNPSITIENWSKKS